MSLQALQSLEALECNYRDNAVDSPPLPSLPMTWAGTYVTIAGVPLLIGAGEIEEIVETPAVTAIPGTKPWVMGVASHMGGLLPIISGDVFFRGRPYSGRVRDFCMVVRRPGFHFGITLSGVERDMKFNLEQRDMDQAVDADFVEFTLGGFHCGDTFLAILDIDKLVADSDLSNAAMPDPEANRGNTDETN
jgi:twitching motility protein PilI